MSDKLKPCPFAHDHEYEPPKLHTGFESDGSKGVDIDYAAYVECPTCGTQGPWVLANEPDAEAKVVAAWNARVSPWVKFAERMPEEGSRILYRDGSHFQLIGRFYRHLEHLWSSAEWMAIPD